MAKCYSVSVGDELLTALVFDANGKQVFNLQVSSSNERLEIDVNNYPSGIYYLRIQNNKGQTYGASKFVVSK